ILTIELINHGRLGEITTLAVCDGHTHLLPAPTSVGEGRVSGRYAHPRPITDEFQAAVANERARQQMRLAQDLKSVADADDKTTGIGVSCHRFHGWRESRDG